MGASIYCAEAEAYTQFTIFDLPKLKKQCLSAPSKLGASCGVKVSIGKGLASPPYRVLRDWEG
jgi:hypothetical protein